MAKKTVEALFCEFTDAELEQKGQELSTTMLKYDEVEAAKKVATAEFTDEMKGLRGSMRGLSQAIRKRGEVRPVDCKVVFHVPEIGIKRTVRLDTGEVVREEAMSTDERQENLFGEVSDLERLYGNGPNDEPQPPQDAA
jgi:hypothetical protein